MSQSHTNAPDRIKKPERQPYLSVILTGLPVVSAAMLLVALSNLGTTGTGVTGFIKMLLLPTAAFMVSYATYRMAIEKAATLFSVGFNLAAIIGLASIIIVGTGLFAATYPGLVITQVEERRLQTYLSDVTRYADARSSAAAKSTQLVPVATAIATDIGTNAACERTSSCVSMKGGGGYGTVARTLETLAGRASAVSGEAASGLERHKIVLADVNAHLAQMEETLADETISIWKRRIALRKLETGLGRLLNELDEAVPASMLSAYAAELREGVALTNQPDVSDRVNGLLASYASNLEAALESIAPQAIERPSLPPRTGAIQTFGYIGEYAPIALLTFAVELVFPLTLWAYTVMALLWDRYRNNPDGDPSPAHDTVFDDLTNLHPVDVPKHRKKGKEPTPRRIPRKR
ncbi:hypothetical protein [Roseibium album]|uniref:Uncharacterized protein n=1 Tax=Roseibium album TaxID=311410 RepID=A0A0M6ZW33_9HYPH|nr:hypothetical protein [Roseibium album]CTQ58143.1 hypothetical protein LA5094_00900 [Roseibium album]CTQ65673.1 hypothetical protein LA5096_00811 [Roseibium album]CTQ70556.1 hypothetical protein LA5095_01955 [Roseibium album]